MENSLQILDISPAEVEERQISPPNLASALEALRTDGAVALLNAIEPEHIRLLHDKMYAEIETALVADPEASSRQLPPPPTYPPYLFRDILCNDIVIGISRALLGDKICNCYYFNQVNLSGSKDQLVHQDVGNLCPIRLLPTLRHSWASTYH